MPALFNPKSDFNPLTLPGLDIKCLRIITTEVGCIFHKGCKKEISLYTNFMKYEKYRLNSSLSNESYT